MDHKKLWKILKEMGIPDHFTCLLRNLYAGQEVTLCINIDIYTCVCIYVCIYIHVFPILNPPILLLDLHTDFSGGRSGGVVFPSLEEFSTGYCDPHKGFGIVNKAEVDVFLVLFL